MHIQVRSFPVAKLYCFEITHGGVHDLQCLAVRSHLFRKNQYWLLNIKGDFGRIALWE